MRIDTSLLPDRLHLKGDFSPMGVSIFTPTCYDKMSREGLRLNSAEKKLNKNSLTFHQDRQANKEVFKTVSKILSELATKKIDEQKKKEIFTILMANHANKYYIGNLSNLVDDFSLFCFNVGVDMTSHLCGCSETGAVSFIALKDFRGEPNAF